ncbi:MAG: response regulator [Elusimicrobiota bacterium]|nr:response regulator [Elusimicrobiota bacterium]
MKVLIVDDNASTREVLSAILKKLGHEVVGEAEDGKSALKAFVELRPEVVLLDIIMPGISGIVVLEEMRRISPAAKIIMLTAVDQDEITRELASKGAAATIFKPFSHEDLIKAFGRLK